MQQKLVAVFFLAFLAGCANAPITKYPFERLSHLIGESYVELKANLGPPHREIDREGGIVATWYATFEGAGAYGQPNNCQYFITISAEGLVSAIDMAGYPSVCNYFITKNSKGFLIDP